MIESFLISDEKNVSHAEPATLTEEPLYDPPHNFWHTKKKNRKLLKSYLQCQHVTVLAIVQGLEIKIFSCRITMAAKKVADSTF